MDADAILVIGGVTGTLCRFLYNAGMSGRLSSWAAAVVSAIAVAVWGYSAGDFTRETTWDYFAGWAAVLTVAAGAFHIMEESRGAVNGIKKMTGTGLALLLAAGLASSCAAGQTLVQKDPSLPQVFAVRDLTARVADSTTAVLQIMDDVGKVIAEVPMTQSKRNAYDCAVLMVIGVNVPSATVTRVCGNVPTKVTAPLPVAMQALETVSTCPGLLTTISMVLGALDPFIQLLESDTSTTLGLAATALKTSVAFARRFLAGGVQCGSI